jgi:cytochrome c peroxidase
MLINPCSRRARGCGTSVFVLAFAAALGACGDDGGDGGDGLVDGFTPAEWDTIMTFGPIGAAPPDPTNRFADDAAAAAYGQRIFFDHDYSGPLVVGDDGTNGGLGAVGATGTVACVSCHMPDSWFMDTRSNPNVTSLGARWTPRNAPSLVNAAFYDWFGWGGKQDSLWMQAATSHESADNTAGNRLAYAHLIYAKYRADYDAIFPVPLDPALDPAHPDAARFPPSGKPKANAADPDGPWELMASGDRLIINTIIANTGKSIAAYERKLVSGNAPIDRYAAGDHGALTAAAKRGLELFIGKAGCDACHSGLAFTDNAFHCTGVLQAVGTNVPATDTGRFDDVTRVLTGTFNGAGAFSDDQAAGMAKLDGLVQEDMLQGRFRTKALRNVATTGPYMHNGSLATLEEVVEFYDRGGDESGFSGMKDPLMVRLNLTTAEKADLVEFLRALTGEEIPQALRTDTSAP